MIESTATFNYWVFFAGIAFFLIGMNNIEGALKALAGRNFKLLLRNYSNHPVLGVLIGTITTAILQSSSVVTLMVIALVGANVIPLYNAVGIVLGANLGTTFTGWLVTFLGFSVKLENFIFPLIAIGGLSYIFITRIRGLSRLGQFVLGLGLMMFGLATLKSTMTSAESFIDIKILSQYGDWAFALTGLILAAVMHSSSTVMVITLSALHSGLIDLPAAAAIVIGADMGTTMTAITSTLKGSRAKKRVALAHFLINLTANTFAFLFRSYILAGVYYAIPDADSLVQLVAFHSSINVVAILLFLPFLKSFTRFLESRFQHNSEHDWIAPSEPSVPEAALQSLIAGIQKFLNGVVELHLHAFQLNETTQFPKGLGMFQIFFAADADFAKKYALVKEQEALILDHALDIQKEPITDRQGRTLIPLVQALREAGLAAKNVKDIEHNIRELESSAESTAYDIFLRLRESQVQFVNQLLQLNPQTQTHEYDLHLTTVEDNNVHFYTQLNQDIHSFLQGDKISRRIVSSVLNLNRELFSARRHLITAHRILNSILYENGSTPTKQT